MRGGRQLLEVWAGLLIIWMVTFISCLHIQSHQELYLPRTCLDVVGNRSLCYTCWQRNLSRHYRTGEVLISSSYGFNYISLEDGRDMVCDQLLGLVDDRKLVEDGVFQLQEVESVYQIMGVVGGRLERQMKKQVVFGGNIGSILIVQVVDKNISGDWVKTGSLSWKMFRWGSKAMLITAILAISLRIFIQLFKKYKQMPLYWTFSLDILVPTLFLYCDKNSYNNLDFQIYKSVWIMFLVSLSQYLSGLEHYVLGMNVMVLASSYLVAGWAGGVVFVLFFFTAAISQKNNLNKDILINNLVLVLLMLILDLYLIKILLPWQKCMFFVFHTQTILFLPSINALMDLKQHQKKMTHKKSQQKQENRNDDELIILTSEST